MQKLFKLLFLSVLLCAAVLHITTFGEETGFKLTPYYRQIVVEIDAPSHDAECKIEYKKTSTQNYGSYAYSIKYSLKHRKFIGVITGVNANESYNVKATVTVSGNVVSLETGSVLIPQNNDTIDEFMSEITDIKTVPLFESASVYVPYDASGATCNFYYKLKGDFDFNNVFFAGAGVDTRWKKAYTPVYINEAKQFSGSITGLMEGRTYEVKADIVSGGNVVKTYSGEFKTWSKDVPVAQTINISDIYDGGRLDIVGIEGSPDGYIKIIGDGQTVINAGKSDTESVFIAASNYVILENLIIKGGKNHGISITNSAENIRIINCDISNWGREGTWKENVVQGDETYAVAYVDSNDNDKRINNDAAIRIYEGSKIVIERNFIHDPNGKTNAWEGQYGETKWKDVHPAGPNGIYVKGRGEIVVRYNDFIGNEINRWNDAIEGENNRGRFGSFAKDSDIYGNMLFLGQDDGIEMDGGAANVRFYKNRIDGFHSGISTAPNTVGPSYIFKNIISNLGDEFGSVGSMIKNGGGTTYSKGVTNIFYNTFKANRGIRGVGYGDDQNRALYHAITRNNILIMTSGTGRAIEEAYESPISSFDYDLISGGAALSLKSENEREENGIFGTPVFVDNEGMDYRLTAGSIGYKSAVKLDGFKGSNIGAIDYSERGLIPYRPISVVPDKYCIQANENGEYKIKLKNHSSKSTGYKILKTNGMENINITPQSGTIEANGGTETEISIFTGEISKDDYKAAFIIKLDNGYSIPISVNIKNEI